MKKVQLYKNILLSITVKNRYFGLFTIFCQKQSQFSRVSIYVYIKLQSVFNNHKNKLIENQSNSQ